MLRDAGNDPLLAGPANAELARIVDVDACIEQDLEDGRAFRDEELPVRALELDREAALAARLLTRACGREIHDIGFSSPHR